MTDRRTVPNLLSLSRTGTGTLTLVSVFVKIDNGTSSSAVASGATSNYMYDHWQGQLITYNVPAQLCVRVCCIDSRQTTQK